MSNRSSFSTSAIVNRKRGSFRPESRSAATGRSGGISSVARHRKCLDFASSFAAESFGDKLGVWDGGGRSGRVGNAPATVDRGVARGGADTSPAPPHAPCAQPHLMPSLRSHARCACARFAHRAAPLRGSSFRCLPVSCRHPERRDLSKRKSVNESGVRVKNV